MPGAVISTIDAIDEDIDAVGKNQEGDTIRGLASTVNMMLPLAFTSVQSYIRLGGAGTGQSAGQIIQENNHWNSFIWLGNAVTGFTFRDPDRTLYPYNAAATSPIVNGYKRPMFSCLLWLESGIANISFPGSLGPFGSLTALSNTVPAGTLLYVVFIDFPNNQSTKYYTKILN